MTPTRSIRVPLGERAYEVRVGDGILSELGPSAASLVRGRRAFLIVDANLPAETLSGAARSLASAGFDVATAHVTATEAGKSMDAAAALLARATDRLERTDPVVALGGGIVGDLGGFVAAIYRRGVPVIQCPTTLLAMVDASVGGKTGVNLRAGGPGADLKKNLVGSFHQPALVIADIATLGSLPDRELRCGLAECVKHGLIAAADGDALLDWTESATSRILTRDSAALGDLVQRNAGFKASVVGQDEREDPDKDLRALLNLGHTFGHAIETIPTLSPDGDPAHALRHGEAVALGLVAAAGCARHARLCGPEVGERIARILGQIGLPVRVFGLPPAPAIIEAMRHDKKVMAGRMRLILPTSGGVRVLDDPGEGAIEAGLAAIRA